MLAEGGGEITIDNEKAARALDRAAGWVGTLSPQGGICQKKM